MCIRDRGLSGHGCFGNYLKRMNRKEEETCRCGAPSETPAHIFIEYIRYSERRPETLNGHEDNPEISEGNRREIMGRRERRIEKKSGIEIRTKIKPNPVTNIYTKTRVRNSR